MQGEDNTLLYVAGGGLLLYLYMSGFFTSTATAVPATATTGTPIYNPQTGQYVDPTTGQPINPATGLPYPNTITATTGTAGYGIPVWNAAIGKYVYPNTVSAQYPNGIPAGYPPSSTYTPPTSAPNNQTITGQFGNRFNWRWRRRAPTTTPTA